MQTNPTNENSVSHRAEGLDSSLNC